MHVIFRTLLTLLRARRRPPLSPWETSTVTLRALPTDIDIAMHINNGQYFSLFDLGRFDLMARAGLWRRMRELGWSPVVQAEQITFRKSVTFLTRFEIHTRMLGMDEKSIYFEQRVVVDGEIYVRAHIAARLLSGSGPVTNEQILDEIRGLGHETPADLDVGEELRRWRESAALPSSRKPAPNVW
ncbi:MULTISPECIES: acyl-CoA thioesterase [Actinomycetes]|uniref:Acyl-CoA thioesterase n=2 Tax=Actinomycetes TaxID=1760 RepID=A0ABP6M4P2_9MICC|nr:MULTISPECIES: acyl-CoA thioesterase [unclassified Nesterenkonia]MDS2173230.1 acyl-CoA thioesterase [Nesterenkonia sp. CL21]OSM42934.1 4-hydroxybenzoyl-CoA thioesterase [Nesterenkonia sp. PF2B19]